MHKNSSHKLTLNGDDRIFLSSCNCEETQQETPVRNSRWGQKGEGWLLTSATSIGYDLGSSLPGLATSFVSQTGILSWDAQRWVKPTEQPKPCGLLHIILPTNFPLRSVQHPPCGHSLHNDSHQPPPPQLASSPPTSPDLTSVRNPCQLQALQRPLENKSATSPHFPNSSAQRMWGTNATTCMR